MGSEAFDRLGPPTPLRNEMRTREKDRGAAAVEFALVFPLVIMLLLSVIEFSRLWNVQATLSDGARISSRYVAVHQGDPNAESDAWATIEKIPGLFLWSDVVSDVEAECAPGESKMVTTTLSISPGSFSEWFSTALGKPIKLVAVGVTPCGG